MTRTVAVACILLLATLASAAELELLQSVGSDDADILLHRPDHVAFAPDGGAYVVNAGDCTILRFDAEWNLVQTFSRQGQGPGEFENATGLLLRDDALWLFEMGRATLFSLDGEYLETRRSISQMQAILPDGEGFLCRLGGSDHAAGRLDGDLELVGKFGPECATDDFFASYKTCGFMSMISHPDWLCLLLNPLDGRLYVVDEGGEVAREIALSEEAGGSQADGDEESVTMSFTLVQGLPCVDLRSLVVLFLVGREGQVPKPAPVIDAG